MPPKKRKFESTFPAARIKKIMQLDNDVGRVASSVPVVISRAVEIFLQALLTRAAGYAGARNAKTLTVGHLKHSIEQEKQWDFLKELTAKISDVTADQDEEETSAPKRGRKRRCSPSQSKPQGRKRRQPKCKARDQGTDNEFGDGKNEYEESESEAENMPVSSTDLPQLIPTSSVPSIVYPSSSLSSLVSAPQPVIPQPGVMAQNERPPAIPSISTLTSGIEQSKNCIQDSDDDYDE